MINAQAKSRNGIDHASQEKIQFSTSESVTVYPSFDSLELKEDLLRGIYGYG